MPLISRKPHAGPASLHGSARSSGLSAIGKVIITVLLSLLISASIVAALVLETEPNIPSDRGLRIAQSADSSLTAPASQEAKLATEFIRRVSSKIVNATSAVTVMGDENEINAAFALINTAYASVSGRSRIAEEKASTDVSVGFTLLGRMFFINLHADIMPSGEGFLLAQSRVGKCALPDSLANLMFKRAIVFLLGHEYGENVLTGIKKVSIKDKSISLLFDPPSGFHEGFANALQRIGSYSGQSIDFEHYRVQYYLDFLQARAQGLGDVPTTIAYLLAALMQETRHLSIKDNTDPTTENMSAIYALAILIEPGVFRHLVTGLELNGYRKAAGPTLTLAGRSDLAKHFIYSAAMDILAQKGVSFSLGEVKEIMDAGAGGSGFSFADIAANRAGIRFTEIATGTAAGARALQEFCANGLQEADFFPSIAALPEGLSHYELSTQFNHIKSDEYLKVLDNIDRALEATPLLAVNEQDLRD